MFALLCVHTGPVWGMTLMYPCNKRCIAACAEPGSVMQQRDKNWQQSWAASLLGAPGMVAHWLQRIFPIGSGAVHVLHARLLSHV